MLSLHFSAFLRSSSRSTVGSPYRIACDYTRESHSLEGLGSAPAQISCVTLGLSQLRAPQPTVPTPALGTVNLLPLPGPWCPLPVATMVIGALQATALGHFLPSPRCCSFSPAYLPGLVLHMASDSSLAPSCFSSPARITAQRKSVGSGVYDRLSQMSDETPVLLRVMTSLAQCRSGHL